MIAFPFNIPSAPDWKIDWKGVNYSPFGALLAKMGGIRQNPVWHGEGDVLAHTRLVCDALVGDPVFRAMDETDRAEVRATLLRLVEEVGRRFRRETRWARTAKLKLRDGTFSTITRQARFELPARDDITFRHLALALFDREWPEGGRRTVRLIGFGVTDFTETRDDPEPSLFPSPLAAVMDKRERLAEVLDRIFP